MPDFRIDKYPNLLIISSALTILFEIGFIFLIFMGRLRYIGVVGGILFHNMTGMFMKINFKSLWYCFVIFFDWSFLYRWYFKILYGKEENYSASEIPRIKYNTTIVSIVGALLIFGNVYAGFGNYVDSWFFSCYPTFQYVKSTPQTSIISIETSYGNGEFEKIDEKVIRSISDKFQYARFYRMVWMIIREGDDDKFMALWEVMKLDNPKLNKVKSIRFFEERVTTLPNLAHINPIKRKLLAEFNGL